MTHIDLMQEVTRQLAGRFQPTPGMIKKRIEALIDVSACLRSMFDGRASRRDGCD